MASGRNRAKNKPNPLQPAKNNCLYENCRIFDMNGELIFIASRKRIKWYADHGLAKIISEDPFAIQLTFETNGDGRKDDDFYLQERENICAVCGSQENLTRHHIVPVSFRSFFSEAVKSHSGHDVIPVCSECHDDYNGLELELRKQLAIEYRAPIGGINYRLNNYDEDVKIR